MKVGSVKEWAAKHGISRQGAYDRIREHGIPMLSPGRIDMDAADQIWEASMNPAKQRGGEAGGAAAAAVHQSRQTALFGDDDEDDEPQTGARSSSEARSMLGQVQLQVGILKIKRERLTIGQLEKKLVSLADVRAFEGQVFTSVKSELCIIAAELADELATIDDPVKIRSMIEDRINQALSKLAEWKPEEEE